MTISKRCFIRIISFSIAIILSLGIVAAQNYGAANDTKLKLQYGYMRAVEDLSLSLDNIKNTLNKGMYAASAAMMSEMSSKLWSDASTAKVALSQLPVDQLNLEQTNKFLSQVGNYSKSLAKKYSQGETLTDEEKANIKTLYTFAQELSDSMWSVEKQIEDGELSFERSSEAANDTGNGAETGYVTEGFTDFEEGFDNYPTLIYDGPFSDHILEREPLMLKNQQFISQEQALEKAAKATGSDNLMVSGEEAGKMPSYVFESGNTTVAVTKAGGYLSYMMKYRQIGSSTISAEKAVDFAEDYLEMLGIDNVEDTYYEIQSGVCIINFAGEENDILLYTDLIKVGVAMDNGEIMSFDGRGYLTNHTTRNLGKPQLEATDAIQKVSTSLTVKKVQLALIPSSGLNEKYCYEFSCTDSEGRNVLVYINADNGVEEDILLLKISNNGVLTV